MDYINEPYTVYYSAKERVSGFVNFELKVRKPDGTFDGLFPMVELGTGPAERGVYIAEYVPTEEGQYLFTVKRNGGLVPTEVRCKSVTFVKKPDPLGDNFSGHGV